MSRYWYSSWRSLPPAAPLLKNVTVHKIRMPKSLAWQPERAHAFIQQLLAINSTLTLQIVAQNGFIEWQVLTWSRDNSAGTAQVVQATYPGAEVQTGGYRHPEFSETIVRLVVSFGLARDAFAPILYASEMQNVDPLALLVQNLTGLPSSARIVYAVHIISPASAEQRKQAHMQITRSKITPFHFLSAQGIGEAIGHSLSGNLRRDKYVSEEQKKFESKLTYQLYNVCLLTQWDSGSAEDVEPLLRHVDGLYAVLSQFDSEFNGLSEYQGEQLGSAEGPLVVEVNSQDEAENSSIDGFLAGWMNGPTLLDKARTPALMMLNTWEIASLWHPPCETFASPAIVWSRGGRVPVPAELAHNSQGVLIGNNVTGGKTTPVYLADQDRESHINIVGKTRVGKSTLMHNLIHQDIQAGKGVGVIDPHGKLVEDILHQSIPPERVDDVVLLDFANDEYPPPLNPLAVPAGVQQANAAGRLMAILDNIYEGFAATPRVADTLSAALLTLSYEQTPTVRDVPRLFQDAQFRYSLLDRLDDTVVEEFWAYFEELSPGQQEQLAYPVVHRMRTFYGNRTLYPIMCHPEMLDLAGLIAAGKILLVSLKMDDEKVPPREQRLLGAVIVAQLQMAAMKAREKASRFHLYVDETQHFVTSSLDEVFSEASKFGLSLVLANQFLHQLRGKTLEAVMGNAGATVVFQVGPDDARALAPYLKPEFSAEDLMNLDLHQAAVKTRHQGRTLPAFSLQTPAPVPAAEDGAARAAAIRQRSIELYTPKSRQEVLDWLNGRYPRPGFRRRRPPGDGPEGGQDDWLVQA